jgi:SAM-dependent MidA family methyltransferase
MPNAPLNIPQQKMPPPSAEPQPKIAHTPLANAPAPSLEQIELSKELCERMFQVSDDGWLSFEQYMQMALYEPSLGYYAGGQQKFGANGDFVTAPILSPLFALAIATQLEQWLQYCEPRIYEFGAGDGTLAAQLLLALAKGPDPLTEYCIIELSPDLKQRQRQTIEELAPLQADRVVWLSQLPENFNGIILGNELLDAMPVKIFELQPVGPMEKGVFLTRLTTNSSEIPEWSIEWKSNPATPDFAAQITQIIQAVDPNQEYSWPVGFESEICPAAAGWIQTIGSRLIKGAILLIDYGFSRNEFYLPARSGGTLMCHYRHYAHTNPLTLPGLQDITAHVDFSTIAEHALHCGLDLLGYTSQARFLVNSKLISHLAVASANLGQQELARLNQGVQRLVSEAEMGELFKVIAFGRQLPDEPSIGFSAGDRSYTLGIN